MRIIQVAPGFLPIPGGGWGGTEIMLNETATLMTRLGHEVTVVNGEPADGSPPPYPLEIVRPRWRGTGNLVSFAIRGLSYGMAVRAYLRAKLRRDPVDVVHFHSQWSAAPAIPEVRRHGVPAIFTAHNWAWSDDGLCRSATMRLMHTLEIRSMHLADQVTCDTNHVARNLVRYHKIEAGRLTAIPNGADDVFLSLPPASAEVRARFAPGGRPVVLTVGRIIPYKNQLTLARALPLVARRHPSVRFLFVGPAGPPRYAEAVRRAVVEAGQQDRAIFTGEVDRATLLELYALADVFVLCSTAESQGMVLMDAMAAGKAVVGSRIGSLIEMLDGGGVLADPANPGALADAIAGLLDDPTLRARYGQTARDLVVRKFTWRTHVDGLFRVYRQASAAFGRPVPLRA